MSERITIPFTNEHFVDWLQKMEQKHSKYWYGSCVYPASESLLSTKAKQYPGHYGSSRMAQYRKDIANKQVVADCVGACKGYAWTNGGKGTVEAIGTGSSFTNKYASNNCPDISASGMLSHCKAKGMDWGAIGTLPEIPGVALFMDGHIGYYIGNGYAIEWRGFNYGCVKTAVKDRPWKTWAKLPFIEYGEGTATNDNTTLGSRSLKKGMTGGDVSRLQELLNQLITASLDVDGDFGSKTEAAVKQFQNRVGLSQTGLYDESTHKALMGALADAENATTDDVQTTDEAHVTDEPQMEDVVVIECGDGAVNIRTGNGTSYSRITTVKDGTAFPYVATAANGWHAVVVSGQVGWVSGKYSKVKG